MNPGISGVITELYGRQKKDKWQTKRRIIWGIARIIPAVLQEGFGCGRTRLKQQQMLSRRKRPFSRTFSEEFPKKWGYFPNKSRRTPEEMRKSFAKKGEAVQVNFRINTGYAPNLSAACLPLVCHLVGSIIGEMYYKS